MMIPYFLSKETFATLTVTACFDREESKSNDKKTDQLSKQNKN